MRAGIALIACRRQVSSAARSAVADRYRNDLSKSSALRGSGHRLDGAREATSILVHSAALFAGTSRIELGTRVSGAVERPGELAHRIQSLNVLLAGRLRLGVGAGSTRADFELAGADYDKRFTTFKESLDVMRAFWRGESVNGSSLLAWPGTEGGPPVFLALVARNDRARCA